MPHVQVRPQYFDSVAFIMSLLSKYYFWNLELLLGSWKKEYNNLTESRGLSENSSHVRAAKSSPVTFCVLYQPYSTNVSYSSMVIFLYIC